MRTITAAQLIEELESLPPNAPVAFASDYGDRGHTQQVIFLRGSIEKMPIRESGYSDSGYALSLSRDEDGNTVEDSAYIIS